MRYENAQNSRFSGQSFRLLQIREYSGGLSRYFVACQSLCVFTTFPVVMSSIPFFLSRLRLSPHGRVVCFCQLPHSTECRNVPSCAVCVAVSVSSVGVGADAAVSARTILILLKASGAVRKEE